MSYHGLGQISMRLTGPSAIDTVQPYEESKPIDPAQYLRDIGFKMTYAQTIPQESSQPISHRAPPAEPQTLPPNYSAEAMGCHGKMAVPINPGNPGYPGFLCVDMKPMTVQYPVYKAFTDAATGGSGSPTGGGRVDLNIPIKQKADGMSPAVPYPGTNPAGSHVTKTKQPQGTVDPAAFASACRKTGGTLGTPNCCAYPDGTKLGMDGGQLVHVLQCDVPKKGLGLPLIAGAAVVALLLARGL